MVFPEHRKSAWDPVRKRVSRAHVILAERLLGRPLRDSECVFHFTKQQAVICDRGYAKQLRNRFRGSPYHSHRGQRLHVVIAEKALGRQLPQGAEVHHVDGDKYNNLPTNLVICQSRAYHFLLHARARVVRAGGNPNTQRFCADCKRLKTFAEYYALEHNQCKECRKIRSRRAYRRQQAARS